MDFVKETELFVKEKVVTEMDFVKETKLFVTEKVVTGHRVKDKSRERATTAPHDKHKSVQSRGACMH